jgi:glycosyltransferase involved in cell wall biosynthesis
MISNSTPNKSISIITPCFNMLSHLQKCVASVKDQGIGVEHIIVDGLSSDGTSSWLANATHVSWVSEADKGMYDALNKGLQMASTEIIGHLNADEQYLPGTLQSVINYFNDHPDVDFIVADFFLVDNNGELKAFRKSFPPFWPFFFSNYLYTFTCTMFIRKRVVKEIQYDSSLKSIADVDFVTKMIKKGYKGKHIKQYFSVYTLTGKNLSFDPISNKERVEYAKYRLPKWLPIAKPFLKLGFYFARIIYGTFWHKGEIRYEIYTLSNLDERTCFAPKTKTWKWQ